MGSLVRAVTGESGITGIGVFILELPPPGVVQAANLSTTGIAGEFPWGPDSEKYTPTSAADLIETMYGPAPQGHVAFRALYGKQFGPVICSRVVGPAATKASVTVEDDEGTPVESVVATANYKGSAGDNISVTYADNADTGGSDVTVSFTKVDGSSYSKTYEDFQASDGTVTDPGDPHVSFAAHANAVAPVAPGTYTLGQAVAGSVAASTAGDDDASNIAAAHYTTAISRLGGASSAVAHLFCVEAASGSGVSASDINGALYTWAGDNPYKLAILTGVSSESNSAALTDAANYRRDNVVKLWPGRVYQKVPDSDGNLTKTLVDGNAFFASLLANLDPWESPGIKRASDFTGPILGLEDESLGHSAYAALAEGGVCSWFMEDRRGAMIRGARSTSLDATENRLVRRRYTTYLAKSLSSYLTDFADSPLDLDEGSLGPNTSSAIGGMRQFLADEEDAAHIIDSDVDPFGATTAAEYALGRWDIDVRVQTVPGAEQIVLRLQAGPSVSI